MIEIVFSDSAWGSLRAAQDYGEGDYEPGCICIFDGDGRTLSPEEIEEEKLKLRLAWEKATPMGGNHADIYGFNLSLSVGDISENLPDIKREQTLTWLYSIYPHNWAQELASALPRRAKDTLSEILNRMAAAEDVRIWYSDSPDEICGLYWFMSQLTQQDKTAGAIYLLKLPKWITDTNGKLTSKTSWGELDSGEWFQCISLQKLASAELQQLCAEHWQTLQKENAPLRAMINGQLVSVPETFYDDLIVREIEKEDLIFHEARLIGRVLGNYRLGIGDDWIAHRIEAMICEGKLAAVTVADQDSPIYHRQLKNLLFF